VSRQAEPIVYAVDAASSGAQAENVSLVRSGRVVARMRGDAPAFTADGKYLVTADNEKVYALDVDTGKRYERRLPFVPPSGCRVARSLIGDSVVIAAPTLKRLSLPEMTTAEPVAADLPQRRPACVVGAARGNMIVLVKNASGPQLYRVDARGATRQIGPATLTSSVDASGPENFRMSTTGPPRLAYTTFEEDRADVVHVLDIDSGKHMTTRTEALGLPGRAKHIYIQDLWWSSSGTLYATMLSQTSQDQPDVAGQQLWQLNGIAWERAGTARWVKMRELPDGRRMVILPGETGNSGSGTYFGDLYVEDGTGLSLVSTDVFDVVTPPQSTPPPTQAPTLGLVWGPYLEGYQGVEPKQISNGGDPTTAVSDITWQNWGSERATGTGTGWVAGDTVAAGHEEKMTVVAADLGTCAGRPAYRSLQWYPADPAYPEERRMSVIKACDFGYQ
jgi:hypothetical protein